MQRHRWLSVAALLAIVLGGTSAADERRNPFDLPDVPSPDDDEVRAFAAQLKFSALDEDPNAPAWPAEVSNGDPMKLDGAWLSRWNGEADGAYTAPATAHVAKIGKRLFIRHFNGEEPAQGGYLIEAVRQGDGIYIGRYSSAGAETSSGYWVGRIVSHERIDGHWTLTARWDFRRKFE